MYKVTFNQSLHADEPTAIFISNEPTLTKAVEMSIAIFRVVKISSTRPLEARQRVIPTGASIEIFASGVNRYRSDSGQLIGVFRCEELPDGEPKK